MFEMLLLAQAITSDSVCFEMDRAGNVINLGHVCDPDAEARARREAAEQAALRARLQQAIVDGDPMHCEFLLGETTRSDSTVSAQASIDIPVVCTALREASGVNVSMTLRANGNNLIGSAYETIGNIRSTDNYRFEATFLGDYIPPVSELEVEYTVSGS